MAKLKKDPVDETIDELLGPDPVLPAKKTKSKKEKPVAEAPKVKETKEPVAKQPRALKGEMVTFQNQKGETILGMGTLYYVVRFKGKLHYKEASQVTVHSHEDLDVEFPEGK